MRNGERLSLEQIRAFLEAAEEVEFEAAKREEVYSWISPGVVRTGVLDAEQTDPRDCYAIHAEDDRSEPIADDTLSCGLPRIGTVKERAYRRHRFATRYTPADVALLVEVDEAHEALRGWATRKILEREFAHYGNQRFERLARISVAYLYNPRKSRSYREKRLRYEKTKPVQVGIGERRRPDPQGKPRHSNDNGLVESKNAAVIRKHIGYGHIGAQYAEAMDRFHREQLNPYLNFHRPCAVPTLRTAANGKRRRVYQRWATPFELFRELLRCESFLRPDVTISELERFAQLQSDTEAALAMQRAKRKLFGSFRGIQTA